MTPQEKLETLIIRLEKLQQVHQNTSIEIVRLRQEVDSLRKEMGISTRPSAISKELAIDEVPVAKVVEETIPEIQIDFEKKPGAGVPPPLPKTTKRPAPQIPPKKEKAFNLEEFIGGNLINKIGILILIIGLGLFVKYAIDKGYFPPLIRLILSFLAGLTLVGIGYRLKSKYKNYSAVLFSGGIAVLYFSAYGGNAFYDPVLLPRTTAFILMVVFTIVTVLAASIYSLEIIALLGLVGAYAVPILLSDGSGDYKLLFSYMAIINTGVLLATLRKNWRFTLYIAFALTWLIFAFWVMVEYESTIDTQIAWVFNLIFFFTFYTALIAHNLLKKEKFTFDSVLFIMANAFIFYGLGMLLLENSGLDKYHGLFTLINGVLHLGISIGLYQKLEDKKLFSAISGLFWLFLTLAIGVQFESDVRSILWFGEAAILFGIGRRFKIMAYEGASFLVLFIAANFLLFTWAEGYYEGKVHLNLFFNRYFLVSVLALALTGSMFWIHQKWEGNKTFNQVSALIIPSVFISILYCSFFNEIYHQFNQAYFNSEIDGVLDFDINRFSIVWLINYTFGFIILFLLANRFYLKNKKLTGVIAVLILFCTFIFISGGMFTLNELRTEYLNPDRNPMFKETGYWIWIRYISYLFAAAALFGLYKILDEFNHFKNSRIAFQLLIYLIVLIVLSNELTTFMTMVIGVDTKSLTHKVGFSILWAVYSLVMIFVGFRQKSKLLRLAGIILFAVTLVKVFFLDLIDLSTESRILLFVAIGILLLVTSFLYQRFGEVLLGDQEE